MSDTVNRRAPKMRDYTPERLLIEFSPAAWHPGYEATLAGQAEHGAHVAKGLSPLIDVRYGPGPLQTMDIFPGPTPSAPACIVFHGGLWHRSDKRFFLFSAEPLVAAGMACFVVNFDHCPGIDLDGIVRQVRDAAAWVQREGHKYQCDPSRIYLFGHATGAHLAATLLTCDWNAWPDFDPGALSGSLLVSGLYDLRYFPQLPINEILKLTPEAAARCSPLLAALHVKAPMIIAAAAGETPEFIAQSRDMADAAAKAGAAVKLQIVDGVGHFDILDTLSDLESPLMRDFIALVNRTGNSGQ